MMKRRSGFSLLEIVMAMAFMSVGILSMFMLNKSSSQGSMDAYYEFLAFSLAREPIEVFRGFGYETVNDIAHGRTSPPSRYPVGGFADIDFDPMSEMSYPFEARLFEREILLQPANEAGVNGIHIKVTVAAKGLSRAEVWMRKQAVRLESIILERPK